MRKGNNSNCSDAYDKHYTKIFNGTDYSSQVIDDAIKELLSYGKCIVFLPHQVAYIMSYVDATVSYQENNYYVLKLNKK